MVENKEVNNEEVEIDLNELFKLIKKNLRFIILTAVIVALIALSFTVFFIDKKYSSSSKIYIIPKVTEQGIVDASSVQTNSKLVNNYMEIIKGEAVISKVVDELGNTNIKEITSGLSVSNQSDTEIIEIKATTTNPILSRDIVSTTIDVFVDEMKELLKIENITVLNEAKINETAVSPSIPKNTVIGGLVGVMLACGFILMRYLLDRRLRNRDLAESFLGVPVLVCIPAKRGK